MVRNFLARCLLNRQVRQMSSLKKGMKEFYLAVHPDFFNDYPNEKQINEQSLKLLHSHVDTIKSGGSNADTSLTFYKKHKESATGLLAIRLKLKTNSTTSIYQEILRAFDVPFDQSEVVSGDNNNVDHIQNVEPMDLGNFQMKVKEMTLVDWVTDHIDIVREAQLHSEPIQLSVLETSSRLKDNFGIRQIIHNNKFTYRSINSLLNVLEVILHSKEEKSFHLMNRSIVFSNFTGLDHMGRFSVDFFSPPEVWKEALENLGKSSEILDQIEEEKHKISTSYFGIRFVNPRSSNPIPIIPYYKSLLRISHQLEKDQFMEDKSFKNLLALFDWDDSFVGVSKEGFLKIPPLTSKRILFDYVSKYQDTIVETRKSYLRNMRFEHKIMNEAKTALHLDSVIKDPVLDTNETIQACQKIINQSNLFDLSGCNVMISTYYDISPDGFVRIPWNFLQ